jgi:hypothetical protein
VNARDAVEHFQELKPAPAALPAMLCVLSHHQQWRMLFDSVQYVRCISWRERCVVSGAPECLGVSMLSTCQGCQAPSTLGESLPVSVCAPCRNAGASAVNCTTP